MSVLDRLRKEQKHIFVGGVTQTGKTHSTVEYGRGWPGPVFLFNPQDFKGTDGYIRADGSTEIILVLRALKTGKKVNYVPGRKRKKAAAELDKWISLFFEEGAWSPPLLVIVDETHFYSKDGRDGETGEIARVGLRWGIVGAFISQSPADTAKVLLRQSQFKLFFKIDLDDQKYLREKGYPVEKMVEMQNKGGNFSFSVYEYGTLTGPFKV